MKLLFESWREYSKPPQDESFLSLLKEHDNKKISDQQLFLEWKKQTTAELEQLNEIDWEKEAELTADPNYKPPHERPGMLSKGWEKVNDFLLKKAVELTELIKRSKDGAIEAWLWLNKQIDRFREKHPVLYNIVKALIIVAIIFGLFVANAQADVLNPDGSVMSDERHAAVRGMIDDYGNSKGTIQAQLDTTNMIELIDRMHVGKLKHDPNKVTTTIGKMLKFALDHFYKVVDQSIKGDAGATGSLKKWYDVGKNLKI